MKKKLIVITTFLFLINFISAQKGYKSVHPSVLNNNECHKEFFKSLPENCSIFKFDLSVVASGVLRKTVEIEKESMGKWFQKLMPSPKKGDKIFIVIRNTNCKELLNKEYKFILNDQPNG